MTEPLPAGTRVRHYGHQWPKAIARGTATVVEHFYVGPHLEYRVRFDAPKFGATGSEWSASATIPIPPERPLWAWRFDHA